MRIIVLLSSYNGEKYIVEQIESILNQTIRCELVVRDDGSTDSTIKILDKYKEEGKLSWYSGENLGPAESFFYLIKHADVADYYALSDQDDVWQKDKLENAIRILEMENESPRLYFGKRTIVDEKLKTIDVSNTKVRRVDPGTSLIEGIAYGCTMVFDYETKKMIENLQRSHLDYMHDAFLYRVVSLCGKVVYDDNSYILYRQHSNNVIGHELMGIQRWILRFNHLPKRRKSRTRSDCAKDIYENYKERVKPKYLSVLYNVAYTPEKLRCRLQLVFSFQLHTQHALNVTLLKPFILLGWL